MKGRPGQKYFGEYDIDGNISEPTLTSGRGINIAQGVKRPVVTNHSVTVCCMQLFMYIMVCRRGERSLQSENKVTVLWDQLLDELSEFAKDLAESGDFSTESSYAHTVLCMEIR